MNYLSNIVVENHETMNYLENIILEKYEIIQNILVYLLKIFVINFNFERILSLYHVKIHPLILLIIMLILLLQHLLEKHKILYYGLHILLIQLMPNENENQNQNQNKHYKLLDNLEMIQFWFIKNSLIHINQMSLYDIIQPSLIVLYNQFRPLIFILNFGIIKPLKFIFNYILSPLICYIYTIIKPLISPEFKELNIDMLVNFLKFENTNWMHKHFVNRLMLEITLFILNILELHNGFIWLQFLQQQIQNVYKNSIYILKIIITF